MGKIKQIIDKLRLSNREHDLIPYIVQFVRGCYKWRPIFGNAIAYILYIQY